MSPTDDLLPTLKKLRLSGVLQTLELRIRQTAEDDVPYSEFLYRLLSDKVGRREATRLQLRLRQALFEHNKTIEDTDFSFNPNIPKSQIIDLATCNFIELKRNVCLIGPAGVGKSHVGQALGHRACRTGYATLFISANKMFSELRAARADDSYERRMLRFTNPALLIVDDLGLRPLRDSEPEDLYEVNRRRYERGSILITSNREVEERYPLFGEPLMAGASQVAIV